MDVTNPGLVNVADEVEGNPDPNGGTSQAVSAQDGELADAAGEVVENPDPSGGTSQSVPLEDDVLAQAAAQGYPPAPVDAKVFPTPADVQVQGVVPLYPSSATYPPPAAEVDVAAQSLAGVSTPEFVVAGPTISIQTNRTEETATSFVVLAALDADHLPAPAGPLTTRYMLVVATPPALTSFGVSLLGRQVTFADDTTTVADQGVVRLITGYGGNYVVITRDDPTVDSGGVPQMVPPQPGDVFSVQTYRQGSEDVSSTGAPAADVVVAPPPPAFVPFPGQADKSRGNVDVSTGPQPGTPFVGSGTPAPASITVEVADQSDVVGLPTNVFV